MEEVKPLVIGLVFDWLLGRTDSSDFSSSYNLEVPCRATLLGMILL